MIKNRSKTWTTIKIVIISIIGLVLLTLMTANKPVKVENKKENLKKLP